MSLNENINKNLRENLSKNAGGGLHLKAANAKLIDAPILAIGLGGTGAEALIRLKHMVNERLNSDFSKDKPTNIEYLLIDTDKRTKNIQFNGTKVSEGGDECYIMEDAMLPQTYRNLGSHQMPYVNDWISTSINVSYITNGAGGIRQIGRFLFFKEFQNVLNVIKRKMLKITQGKSNRQRAYVFIATGISGGTGSGTFIDIPYIIRNIFSEIGFNVQIIGFLFLPDVNIMSLPIEDDATRRNIQRNGFAALKELDYLMNLGSGGNKERFTQEYGGGFKVDYDQAPYDICHLVSSNRNGVNNVTRESCMQVTAETIINFIADEPNISNHEFTIAQYLSNIVTTSGAFIGSLDTKLPINYKYNVIGSSTGILPMDDVLNYLTHMLFNKMHELYNKKPTDKDVSDIVEQLALGINSVEIAIRKNVTLKDIDLYKYDSIKSDPMLLEKILSDHIQNTLIHVMDKNLKTFIDDFAVLATKKLNAIFIDLDKGPSFASRLVNSYEGSCLLKFIKDKRDGFLVNKKQSDIEIGRLYTALTTARNKIIEIKPILNFNKEGLVKDYKKAVLDYHMAMLQNIIIDKMSICYDEAEYILNENNNKIYTLLTEMINSLKNIFEDYAGIATETKEENTDEEKVFTWDIIEPDKLISEVLALIYSDEDYKVNLDNVISNFISDLINNSSEWLNKEKPNASLLLNQLIINNFSQIVNKSIDFYIDKITESDKQKADNYISNLMSKLADNALVMFPLSIYGDTLKTPVYKYFSIPYNTETFNDHLQGIGTVKKSIITNRIFMLNVNLAYPLMAYRELENYESIYETFVGNLGVGMHLYEGTKKNWQDLPSPISQKGWSAGYVNKRQHKINENIKSIFSRAREFGYITWDEQEMQFLCHFAINIKQDIVPNIDDLKSKSDILKAITVLKTCISSKTFATEKQYLYDLNYNKLTNELDLDYSIGVFINMPELNKHVEQTVLFHESVLNAIKLLEVKNKDYVIYSQFAMVLYTNLIKKERANYKYFDSADVQKTLFAISPDIEDNYFEYYVFNSFKQMDAKERDYLINKAKQMLSDGTDDEINQILDNMRNVLDIVVKTRKELSLTHEAVLDGSSKIDFYTELRDEIDKAVKVYS